MKQRILIICDDPSLNTGYARVGRFVAKTLHEEQYQVRYLPCNAIIPEVDRTQWGYSVDAFNPADRYNNHAMTIVLTTYKPSLVMVFGEFLLVGYVGNVCRQYGIQSLYYFPVEGRDYPPAMIYAGNGHIDYKLSLQKFNYIVAYSDFGADNISKLLPGIVSAVIPHQVDTKVFRPLDRTACLTKFFPQLLGDKYGIDSVFIVGHVGRNQDRKGTDLVLQGFADFIHSLPPNSVKVPYLFMTTDPKDVHGYNIYSMVDELGIKGHVIINPVVGGKQGPADNQMAEVYNTFDVHLAPHRAEGFGLCVLESMACGVTTITTNYATPAIFGKDVCTFIPVERYETREVTNMKWAIINPASIGDLLYDAYISNTTKQVDASAVARAATYAEAVIAPQWVNLLASLQLPTLADAEIVLPAEQVSDVVDDYLSMVGN